MRAAGGGRIVNIGAVYSRYPDPTFFATSVNRAAGNSFTKTLALEVAKDNILVNGVNIGFVITPQWENIHRRRAPDVPREEFFDTIRPPGGAARPLRRRRTRSRAWSRSCSASARATSRARRSTSPAAWAGTSSGVRQAAPRDPSGPRCAVAARLRASVHDIEPPRPPRSRPRRRSLARAARFARTERGVATIALGAVALHIADDNFLQPEPGTSPFDHLASGLIPIARPRRRRRALPPRARRDPSRTRTHVRRARDRVRDPERLLARAGRGVRRPLHDRPAHDRRRRRPRRHRLRRPLAVTPLVRLPPPHDPAPRADDCAGRSRRGRSRLPRSSSSRSASPTRTRTPAAASSSPTSASPTSRSPSPRATRSS